MVRASSPPKCLDRDCVGRRRTGIRHGNVYRNVREKQGNVVYRHRVLQTVTSLRVVSLVFRGHDLQKIANINPQQEATLSLWKMEPRSWSTLKRRLPKVFCFKIILGIKWYLGGKIAGISVSHFPPWPGLHTSREIKKRNHK